MESDGRNASHLMQKSYWQNCQQRTTDGNTKPASAQRIVSVHLFEIIAKEYFIR
jgi:hypothetical protein